MSGEFNKIDKKGIIPEGRKSGKLKRRMSLRINRLSLKRYNLLHSDDSVNYYFLSCIAS